MLKRINYLILPIPETFQSFEKMVKLQSIVQESNDSNEDGFLLLRKEQNQDVSLKDKLNMIYKNTMTARSATGSLSLSLKSLVTIIRMRLIVFSYTEII